MKHSTALASVLAVGLVIASPAGAADITSPMAPELKQTEREGWTFAVAPYFWAAGMSGDTELFGLPTVHIDTIHRFSGLASVLNSACPCNFMLPW